MANWPLQIVCKPIISFKFNFELTKNSLTRPALIQHCDSHLLVRGDVQSPLACLLNCKMLLPDIYVGLPVQGTVTIFNQTMLPTQFKWKVALDSQLGSCEESKLCDDFLFSTFSRSFRARRPNGARPPSNPSAALWAPTSK